MSLLKISLLFALLTSFAAQSREESVAKSSCAPLLSNTHLSAREDLSAGEGTGQWSQAYLNLLDLVLEGIDEIAADTFGHEDRSQFKAELLNELVSNQTPANPLGPFPDSARPAMSRNLTNLSPKLSTLAESGQFDEVVSNLHPEDWVQIRQAIELKLTQLQYVQTAQVITKPVTQEDFVDKPDLQGETRLFRLIRAQKFAEAERLVESSTITTLYINKISKAHKTALDILKKFLESAQTPEMISLLQKMKAKEAKTFSDLSGLNNKLKEAALRGHDDDVRQLYSLGADYSDNFRFAPILIAFHNDRVSTFKLLLELHSKEKDVSELAQTFFILQLFRSRSNLPLVEVLFDFFDFRAPIHTPDVTPTGLSPFEYAALARATEVMELLIKRGGFVSTTPNLASLVAHNQLVAFKNSHQQVDPTFLTWDILVKLNINLNSPDENGATIVHLAAREKKLDVLTKLCVVGADFEALNNNGEDLSRYWVHRGFSKNAEESLIKFQNLVKFCKQIRQKYFHVSPQQMHYTAYVDSLERLLRELDAFSQPAYNLSDRQAIKIRLLSKLIAGNFDLLNISKEYEPSIYKHLQSTLPKKDFDFFEYLSSAAQYLAPTDKQKVIAIAKLRLSDLSRLQDASYADHKGNTSLHRLLSAELYLDVSAYMTQSIINSGDFMIPNHLGETPLDILQKAMHDDYKSGANVNAKDSQGATALHHAARSKSTYLVLTLLALGADASLKNHNGHTPADMVAPSELWKLLRYLENKQRSEP